MTLFCFLATISSRRNNTSFVTDSISFSTRKASSLDIPSNFPSLPRFTISIALRRILRIRCRVFSACRPNSFVISLRVSSLTRGIGTMTTPLPPSSTYGDRFIVDITYLTGNGRIEATNRDTSWVIDNNLSDTTYWD